MSDIYDDVQLDWVDARVASILSPGGVCHYEIVDPGVTQEWIGQVVTPQIREVFGLPLAVLFGKAILWLAFSPHQAHVPRDMHERITAAYAQRATIEHGENPIRRRLVTVTGDESRVYMEDVPLQDGNGNLRSDHGDSAVPLPPNPSSTAGVVGGDTNRQLLMSILSQIQGLQRSTTEQTNALEIMRGTLRRHDRTVSLLARKIDNNPMNLLRRANANAIDRGESPRRRPTGRLQGSPQRITMVDDGCAANAVFSSHPRTLNDLWREWMEGIGGNKAAKYFTSRERGRCKHKYSRRKVAWDLIAERVRAGQTASQAIDGIYAAFGPNLSVTQIINAIKRAKSRNEMPVMLRLDNGDLIPAPRPFPRVLLTEPLDPNREGGVGVRV